MTAEITVMSPLLTRLQGVEITPAQRAALWELAAFLDEQHIPAPEDPSRGDAVWVRIETTRLRGPGARTDNVWLRELLRRLQYVHVGGSARAGEWGGVLVAQWEIEEGGRIASILIPPGGLAAFRAPATFARIDQEAAHRLPAHAQTLYGLLADRQRQNVKHWRVDLEGLKDLLGVSGKYEGRFNNFKRFVLDPAVKAINDFGVISVKWEAERLGRPVVAVRFSWSVKDLSSAAETDRENKRHSKARGKAQSAADAPPLLETAVRDLSYSGRRALAGDVCAAVTRAGGITYDPATLAGHVEQLAAMADEHGLDPRKY